MRPARRTEGSDSLIHIGVHRYFRRARPLVTTLALAALCAAVVLAPRDAAARYASIVLDAQSGEILYEKNANTRNYPASLTKMMTLYLVFEALENGTLKPDQRLKVSRRAAHQPRSKLGLRSGQRITVENVILALVTKSANDAATVVAEALAGSEIKFARRMTEKARALGMDRTTFRNASGLYNRRQMTTARDLATLAVSLMRDFPQYYHYFSTHEFTYRGRTHRNHNKLLRKYEGTDGIKTGYIRASGFNLAVSTVRNGRRLVGVVMGGRTGRSRDRHMINLLSRAYKKDHGTGKVLAAVTPEPRATLGPTLKPQTQQVLLAAAVPPRPTSPPATKPPTPLVPATETAPESQPSTGTVVAAAVTPQHFGRPWTIQVGAYRERGEAVRATEHAMSMAPHMLQHAVVEVSALDSELGRFYRARLQGISAVQPLEICQVLHERRMPCIAIQAPRLASCAAAPESHALWNCGD